MASSSRTKLTVAQARQVGKSRALAAGYGMQAQNLPRTQGVDWARPDEPRRILDRFSEFRYLGNVYNVPCYCVHNKVMTSITKYAALIPHTNVEYVSLEPMLRGRAAGFNWNVELKGFMVFWRRHTKQEVLKEAIAHVALVHDEPVFVVRSFDQGEKL